MFIPINSANRHASFAQMFMFMYPENYLHHPQICFIIVIIIIITTTSIISS